MIKQHITSVITNIWGQLQGTCVFVYPEHTLTGLQPNLMGKIFDLISSDALPRGKAATVVSVRVLQIVVAMWVLPHSNTEILALTINERK